MVESLVVGIFRTRFVRNRLAAVAVVVVVDMPPWNWLNYKWVYSNRPLLLYRFAAVAVAVTAAAVVAYW